MQSLDDILERKAGLVRRIDAQRSSLASELRHLQPAFSVADRTAAAAVTVRRNWHWLGLGMGLALLARRLRRAKPAPARTAGRATAAALALIWLRRGMSAWRAWNWAGRAMAHYRQQIR